MSKDYDEIIEDYHNNHEVEYVLMVKVDGEVLAKYTSGIDAADVSCESDNLQEKLNEEAMDEERGRLEYEAESAAEAQMQEELDNRE